MSLVEDARRERTRDGFCILMEGCYSLHTGWWQTRSYTKDKIVLMDMEQVTETTGAFRLAERGVKQLIGL